MAGLLAASTYALHLATGTGTRAESGADDEELEFMRRQGCNGAGTVGAQIDLELDRQRIDIDGISRSKRKGDQVDDLNNYSILQRISTETKQAAVEMAAKSNALNRAMGSMVGMAVGDFLGHPFEFLPATEVINQSHFDLASLTFHGEWNKFKLKRGQWTDDSSMGLCMADSLIVKHSFDGSDMRVRFWCWWNRGYDNAFRKDADRSGSVGLGGNISKSLFAITKLKKTEVPAVFEAQGEDAGNGSLMRLTPIPIFFQSAPTTELHEKAACSSYTTHPGIMAAECCALLAHLIARALQLPPGGADGRSFLEKYVVEYYETSGLSQKSGWGYDQMKQLVTSSPVNETEAVWNWKADTLDIAGTLKARGQEYNGYPVSAGYFGSFCMDGLAMALWCIYHSDSFDEAVVRSVNLCGDADSHGSITGQLAGALYGYSSIHPQFISWLTEWDDHDFAIRGILLHKLGVAKYAQ